MHKVIYHAHCVDGFTAAWIAHLKYGSNTDFIPMTYNDKLDISKFAGHDVSILDFSFKRDVTENLAKITKSLVILDHHISAQKELVDLPYAKFEREQSGATMAWEYFFPGTQIPKFVQYVRDRDLWKFNLPDSRIFSLWLKTQSRTFDNWTKINRKVVEEWISILDESRGIESHVNFIINLLSEQASEGSLNGWRCLAVNSPIYQSEIGEILQNKAPIGLIYWEQNNKVIVSLRSHKVDVSEIAKFWSGGGNPQTAGFSLECYTPKVWELGTAVYKE